MLRGEKYISPQLLCTLLNNKLSVSRKVYN